MEVEKLKQTIAELKKEVEKWKTISCASDSGDTFVSFCDNCRKCESGQNFYIHSEELPDKFFCSKECAKPYLKQCLGCEDGWHLLETKFDEDGRCYQ